MREEESNLRVRGHRCNDKVDYSCKTWVKRTALKRVSFVDMALHSDYVLIFPHTLKSVFYHSFAGFSLLHQVVWVEMTQIGLKIGNPACWASDVGLKCYSICAYWNKSAMCKRKWAPTARDVRICLHLTLFIIWMSRFESIFLSSLCSLAYNQC